MYQSVKTSACIISTAAYSPVATAFHPFVPRPILAILGLTLAPSLRWLGIVLGLALIAVLFAEFLASRFGTSRFRNYFVVLGLMLVVIVSLWFVVGVPQWTDRFLQWLGFVLIQGYVAVGVVEWLSSVGRVKRTEGYLIAVLIIMILCIIAWLAVVLR